MMLFRRTRATRPLAAMSCLGIAALMQPGNVYGFYLGAFFFGLTAYPVRGSLFKGSKGRGSNGRGAND